VHDVLFFFLLCCLLFAVNKDFKVQSLDNR